MSKRILIADDDPDLREAACMVLAASGYEALQAASASETWGMLQTEQIDLLILDVMMETHTEGFHLAYRVRQDENLKSLPIIILTGIEAEMGEFIEPDHAGDYLPVEAYIRKPLDPEELKPKVAECLKQGN